MSLEFSDTTNLDGIVEDIDFACDTNSTSYPLKDKARNVNKWYLRAIAWWFEASPIWEWDDKNSTTLPVARTTLFVGQQDYSIPTDILRLQKVTILDAQGNEVELHPVSFDEFKRRTLDANPTNGIPSVYCLRGDSILLDQRPATGQVTLSNGLNLYISRDPDLFTSGDTTQTVSLPSPFAFIVSTGATYEFKKKYDKQAAASLKVELDEYKRDFQKFLAGRVEDIKPSIKPIIRTRQYM